MFRLLYEKEELQEELNKLMHRVDRFSKYHDFLLAVMTEGGGYDEPRQVMTRHATLTHLLVVRLCLSVSIAVVESLIRPAVPGRCDPVLSASGKALSLCWRVVDTTCLAWEIRPCLTSQW